MKKYKLFKLICKNSLSKKLIRNLLFLRLKKVPAELAIETTNLCNFDCIMCPRKGMKRPMKQIEKGLFERIVNEAISIGVKALLLHNYGEPLIVSDSDFAYFLNYIRSKSKSIFIKLDTNAMLLIEEKIKIIIENNVSEVSITLGGATAKTYSSITRGQDLEAVELNILNLINYKKRLKKILPKVSVNMIRMIDNQNEIGPFLKKWQNIADSVSIIGYSTRAGSLVDRSTGKKAIEPIPCFRLWKQMVICNDGKVALCCNDWDCRYSLGDVNYQSISEIWHSKKLNEYRLLHLNRQRDKIPICSICFPEKRDSFPLWWC